jgi:hypothetical protein
MGSEKKENNDFDWVEGVSSNLPKDRPWVLVNDVDSESEEVSKAMQKFLFEEKGFQWISGRRDLYNKPFLALEYQLNDHSLSTFQEFVEVGGGIGYHDSVGRYYRASSEEKKQEYERRLRKLREEFGDDVYFWSDISDGQINESDDFDWIRTSVPTVRIGGKNDYPIEDVPLGTKVITPEGNVFTIEDIAGGHMDFQHVWGRDLKPAWLGPKNYVDNRNWHNALFLRKVGNSINESNDFDWIEDVYKTEWSFGDIAQLYHSGDVDFVKIVGFKDLKHLNGAIEWCTGGGDTFFAKNFFNTFKVGGIHQMLSTNIDHNNQINDDFTISDLDCGWCQEDPDSIGYVCNKKTKTMTLRLEPKDSDFFVFSEDWVKLEPIFKSDELNESSEGLEWIRDVEADDSVRFDKDKLYYFNPPLNHDEIINLMNRIPNESKYTQTKKWFESVFGGTAPQRYISYFNVDDGDRNDGRFYVSGWCSETNWSQIIDEYYEDSEPVNGRDEFFGHYKIMEEKVGAFDWVEDIVPNPFNGRDIKFYIDETPTQEQSEKIWGWLIDAGVTDMESVVQFNRVDKLMRAEGTFLFVDYDGDLLFNVSDLGGYIELNRISSGNIIRFSDIFTNDDPNDLSVSIKESDDFDWVKDVPLTLNHIFNQLEIGDELTLKGNTHGSHHLKSPKFKYTEPFKITIQSIGPRLEDSDFKISVREKEAIVNLGIKHKGELLKKYPNSHVFKNNSFFEEDGDLEVVSWVKAKDKIEESKSDFDWAEGFTAEFVKGVCLLRKDGTRWLVVDPPKHASKGTTLVWLQRTHTQGVDITKKKRPISPFRPSTLTRQLQSGLLTICN